MKKLEISILALVFGIALLARPSFAFTPLCDRGQMVIRAFENQFGVSCAEITEEDFLQVTVLTLHANATGELRVTDLDGLVNLKRLSIDGDPIIASGTLGRVFKDLTQLEGLELNARISGTLERSDLSSVAKLKSLSLALPSTQKVADDAFDDLTELENVIFRFYDTPATISGRHFEKMTKLKSLNGNFKKLKLSSDTLKNNPLLKVVELDFRYGGWLTLPKDLFSNQESLEELSLKGLKTNPPEDLLKGRRSLKKLLIEDSSFQTLPARLLRDCTGLLSVRLSGNEFEDIDDHFFDGLKALESLFVYGSIGRISKSWLNDLPNLQMLTLYNLGGGMVPDDMLAGVPNLTSLDLTGNDLQTLSSGFFDSLSNLRTLSLNDNEFTYIPISDANLSTMNGTEISLGGNPIPAADIQAAKVKWPNVRIE